MSNIYYWEKLTFSKLMGKINFLERKFEGMSSFVEQKCTRNIQGNVYFGIIVFSCLLSKKLCLRLSLICFAQVIKGFYQSSLENEVDFRDIMNASPDTLAKNWQGFVDERALITTTLISFLFFKWFALLDTP